MQNKMPNKINEVPQISTYF